MTDIQKKIRRLAKKYHLQIIYALGSRAQEILAVTEGKRHDLSPSCSDLDIGLVPETALRVEDKVKIAIFFEDLYGVSRVDVVVLTEAPPFLAVEVVQGELLYSENPDREADYQLYVLRRAADLMPFERLRRDYNHD